MDTTALVTEMERRVIAHVDMDAFYCQVRAFMAMHPAAAQHARALLPSMPALCGCRRLREPRWWSKRRRVDSL